MTYGVVYTLDMISSGFTLDLCETRFRYQLLVGYGPLTSPQIGDGSEPSARSTPRKPKAFSGEAFASDERFAYAVGSSLSERSGFRPIMVTAPRSRVPMAMPTPILAFLVRPEQRGLPSAWIEPPRSSCISRGIFSSCWSEVATLPYVQSICRGGMFTARWLRLRSAAPRNERYILCAEEQAAACSEHDVAGVYVRTCPYIYLVFLSLCFAFCFALLFAF